MGEERLLVLGTKGGGLLVGWGVYSISGFVVPVGNGVTVVSGDAFVGFDSCCGKSGDVGCAACFVAVGG
jgi:hypothetical protein